MFLSESTVFVKLLKWNYWHLFPILAYLKDICITPLKHSSGMLKNSNITEWTTKMHSVFNCYAPCTCYSSFFINCTFKLSSQKMTVSIFQFSSIYTMVPELFFSYFRFYSRRMLRNKYNNNLARRQIIERKKEKKWKPLGPAGCSIYRMYAESPIFAFVNVETCLVNKNVYLYILNFLVFLMLTKKRVVENEDWLC